MTIAMAFIIGFVPGLVYYMTRSRKYQYLDGGLYRKCRTCWHTEQRPFLKASW